MLKTEFKILKNNEGKEKNKNSRVGSERNNIKERPFIHC